MSTRAQRRIAGRVTLTVVKDLILFGIGSGLIVKQGFYTTLADFNIWAMIFGGVLANVPAAQYLWALRSGSTASPTSPPEPPAASLPQSSSSVT